MGTGMDGNVREVFEGFRTGAKGDHCSCGLQSVGEEDEFYDFILSFQDGSYQVDHIVCTRGMSNAGLGIAQEVERQEDEIKQEEEEDDDEYWEDMQASGECNAPFLKHRFQPQMTQTVLPSPSQDWRAYGPESLVRIPAAKR